MQCAVRDGDGLIARPLHMRLRAIGSKRRPSEQQTHQAVEHLCPHARRFAIVSGIVSAAFWFDLVGGEWRTPIQQGLHPACAPVARRRYCQRSLHRSEWRSVPEPKPTSQRPHSTQNLAHVHLVRFRPRPNVHKSKLVRWCRRQRPVHSIGRQPWAVQALHRGSIRLARDATVRHCAM